MAQESVAVHCLQYSGKPVPVAASCPPSWGESVFEDTGCVGQGFLEE